MVITDTFVYLHISKTGGTFVERVLGKLFGGQDSLYIDTSTENGRSVVGSRNQHETYRDIPLQFRDRKILVSVRNPYDHYVSHYRFPWWKRHPGMTFDEAAIRHRYPHYPDLLFSEYLDAINDWTIRSLVNPRPAELFVQTKLGHLTWELIRTVFKSPLTVVENLSHYIDPSNRKAELPDITFLNMSNLNQELYSFLQDVGYAPDRIGFILELGKILPPEGGRKEGDTWEDYYTPARKAFVRERDCLLFSMFPTFDC